MKNKLTNNQWNRIEYNPINSHVRIGYYDSNKNQFVEVIRWRNTYNAQSGANYGLLQIWSITYDYIGYESQGGYNTCGGYNKPIANLESILYDFVKTHDDFNFSNCGSIQSLLDSLKEYVQHQYNVPLFTITLI